MQSTLETTLFRGLLFCVKTDGFDAIANKLLISFYKKITCGIKAAGFILYNASRHCRTGAPLFGSQWVNKRFNHL